MSPEVAEIRKAAGLPELDEWQSIDAIAGECLRALGTDLGERYSRQRTLLCNYQIYDADQRPAIEAVKTFMRSEAANLREGRGLILFGDVGTGKDHLLAACLYHIASAGVPTRWVNGQEIFGRFRDSMDTGEREEKILREWLSPCVLGISDPIPPRGEVSEWNVMQLYRLLDRRYRAMRPTWITVNARGPDDADARLSSSVFDRLRDGAVMVKCFWPSYRERIKP